MLYVDCGHTAGGKHYTGIQRYVRHTLRHAQALLGPGRVSALSASGSRWSCLPALAAHPLEGLPPLTLASGPPRFDAHSHVLLADRFWHTNAWDALDALLASRARITLVVHDLLSLQQPAWFPAGVGERFERYLRKVLRRANRVVCLSATVKTEVLTWTRTHGIEVAPASVIAPGHRVWSGEPQRPAWLPPAWLDGRTPFVLQVGTLEPRKNHALTLAVMQQQWGKGKELGCLFIGQRGWLMEPFVDAMEQLPQWQRQLLWRSECTDAQLDWCYRRAAAVLYPSASEGYGLPLAEAATAGTSVVASDTSVHREVAGLLHGGSTVRLCEPEPFAFSRGLEQALSDRPVRASLPERDWRHATAELLTAMGCFEASRLTALCADPRPVQAV